MYGELGSDNEELAGLYNDPAPSQSAQLSASSPDMDADLFRVLSSTVEELGLEWSPPEEPSRSHLDDWFLPGRRQAPRQQASPFFPEVHDQITRSWRAPYLSSLRVSSSSTLTSVNGAEEKGYDSLPPLESARPQPFTGRQKPLTCLSHAGLLQLSLDEPIHRLDRRPQRFTSWRSCKCSRQNSSVPWRSRTRTPQHSARCAVRLT